MHAFRHVILILSFSAAPSGITVASEDFAVTALGDGAFVHFGRHEDMSLENAGDIANIGFVIGSDSVAVIDPGGSRVVASSLRAAITERTPLPISHLVLTHAHPDHVFGAGVFADVANVIAHERYPRAASVRAQSDAARFASLAAERAAPQPSRLIAVGETLDIELGERRLRIVAMPAAHTDHDLLVVDEQADLLWASDLVVGERMPSLDGSLTGWLEVLDELAGMPALANARVVPGHGPIAPLTRLLEPQRRYLETLRDKVRAHLEAGDTLSAAIREAEELAESNTTWLLDDLHHPANVTRAWTELEWE